MLGHRSTRVPAIRRSETLPFSSAEEIDACPHQVQELLRRREPFGLAMGDLDHFKVLNDTHGHDAGDPALRLFARTMREAVRADDLAYRYGGEEFVIAVPGLDADDAARALGRIQERLVLALSAGTVPAFTASFGVARAGEGETLDEVCRAADVALFRAKGEGATASWSTKT